MMLLFLFSLVLLSSGAPTFRRIKHQKSCNEMPHEELVKTLGSAYNARYMSVEEPFINEERKVMKNGKRARGIFEHDFYVDDGYEEELSEEPAWEVSNHLNLIVSNDRESNPGPSYEIVNNKTKRNIDYSQQWHCKSKIEWKDLGQDYFPRYLRTVSCLSQDCWFALYKCKPRSFTVKILRRKRRCGNEEPNRVGLAGLPKDLKEMWVWEERAVNFCCDCVKS